MHGTPNAPKKLCFEGKPRSRRRAHERSEVAARSREGWHGISAREAADRRRRSRADRMMTSAPNECRLKGGTRKHLRRQAEQLPLIRRHSIRRTHRQFFSYRKAKTGTSPFIYGRVVIFMPEKWVNSRSRHNFMFPRIPHGSWRQCRATHPAYRRIWRTSRSHRLRPAGRAVHTGRGKACRYPDPWIWLHLRCP